MGLMWVASSGWVPDILNLYQFVYRVNTFLYRRAKMADFADKLLQRMDGMPQSELARQSGVSQVNISRYLSRQHRPSFDHVQALAAALGCTCLDLCDDELPIAPPEPTQPKKRGRPRKDQG